MKFISIDTVLIKMYSKIAFSVKSLRSNFPPGQKWQNVLYSEDILLKVKISTQVKDLGIHTSSRNLKQIPFSLKQLLMPILNDNFFNCRGCWENTHITAHIFTLSGYPVPPLRLNTCGLHLPGAGRMEPDGRLQ